jgi:hypothetical protein
MVQPSTIAELAQQWSRLVAELTDENNEQLAYKMVGLLAGNDALWDEWYASNKEPTISQVFDTVADLEVPNGHLVKDDADRKAKWQHVKACITALEKKYLMET